MFGLKWIKIWIKLSRTRGAYMLEVDNCLNYSFVNGITITNFYVPIESLTIFSGKRRYNGRALNM